MDTTTEAEVAVELGRAGWFGLLHRFLPLDEQADQLGRVKTAGERVGAVVGIDDGYVGPAEPAVATNLVLDRRGRRGPERRLDGHHHDQRTPPVVAKTGADVEPVHEAAKEADARHTLADGSKASELI